jgi:tetratricopeptide (TPR) repeat protein
MRFGAAFFVLTLLGAATASLPEDEAVTFHQARVRLRAGDAEALRLLAGALVKRAETTGSAADYDQAWRILQEAERLEPGELSTTVKQAQVLLSRHRFTLALALLQVPLKKHPDNTDLLALAGDARLEVGDLTGAGELFLRLADSSKRFSSFSRMSAVEEAKGNLEEAARWMKMAIATARRMGESEDTIGWARAVLGEIFLKQGRNEDARTEYVAGLRDTPEHLLLTEHLAELEDLEGNYDTSVKLYRRILARGRPDPENKVRLAEILEKTGSADDARQLRTEAHEFCRRAVLAGNEGYIRPLAKLYLRERDFQPAADLAFTDVALRPSVESKALLSDVLTQAAAAGMPVSAYSNSYLSLVTLR